MNSLEKQQFYVYSLPSEWKSMDREDESIHISFNDIPTTNPIAHWFPAHISNYTVNKPNHRIDILAWVMIEFAARVGSKRVIYFASVIDRDGVVHKYEGVNNEGRTEPRETSTDVGRLSPEAKTEDETYPKRVVPERPSYQGPMVLRKGDRIRVDVKQPVIGDPVKTDAFDQFLLRGVTHEVRNCHSSCAVTTPVSV